MDTKTLAERIAAQFIAGETPEALKKHQFTKNDPDNPNPKGNDRDGDGKTNEKKPDFLKDKEAGCEKLPAGGMRDNCEKKSKGGDSDKKDDKDDKKPDFLKKKESSRRTAGGHGHYSEDLSDILEGFAHQKKSIDELIQIIKRDRNLVEMMNEEGMDDSDLYSLLEESKRIISRYARESVIPVGVVAALTVDGQVKVFEANSPEAADGIKKALQASEGEYSNIVHGPNKEGRTASELYAHFEERWFEAGCEKLPEGGMRENCEKKSKGGDSKSDSKSDDKKDDSKDGKMPADLLDKFKKKK